MSKLDTVKKVAKTAGKVALSIAVPPVGFMTLDKAAKKKGDALVIGVIFSALSNLIMGGARGCYTKQNLYDSPEVNIITRPASNIRALSEMFTSPLAFYLDSTRRTEVVSTDRTYGVKGDNAIVFDEDTGKYVLNLNESSFVGYMLNNSSKLGATPFSSLADLKNERQSKVNELEKRITSLKSEGRILESRIAQEELARTKLDYDSKVSNLQITYDNVRYTFVNAVDAMNYELQHGQKMEANK